MTRVLVADPNETNRQWLRKLIERQFDWRVCGEAATGSEAIRLAAREAPDVVILDITLPETNSLQTARRLKQACPDVEIIVLMAIEADDLVRDLLRAGVKACLLKADVTKHLTPAIDALAQHRPYLTPPVTRAVLSTFLAQGRAGRGEAGSYIRLTSREREILQLFAEGHGNSAVSDLLDIRVKTVQTHRSRIMKKLGVGSLAELVRYAIRNGLIQQL